MFPISACVFSLSISKVQLQKLEGKYTNKDGSKDWFWSPIFKNKPIKVFKEGGGLDYVSSTETEWEMCFLLSKRQGNGEEWCWLSHMLVIYHT